MKCIGLCVFETLKDISGSCCPLAEHKSDNTGLSLEVLHPFFSLCSVFTWIWTHCQNYSRTRLRNLGDHCISWLHQGLCSSHLHYRRLETKTAPDADGLGQWCLCGFLAKFCLLPILKCVFSWMCPWLAPYHDFVNTCFSLFTKSSKKLLEEFYQKYLGWDFMPGDQLWSHDSHSSQLLCIALVMLCRLEGRWFGQHN